MRRIPADDCSTPQNAPRRQAFTLIELMIVIVVIAILMSLVLPAVQSSFVRAKVTEVVSEIRGLEAAIAQFKNVYGIEPPSRIRLYEASTGSPSWLSDTRPNFTEPITGTSISQDSERIRSIALINRIWPNFNFTAPLGDVNGNGSSTDVISLTGAECLVFFLGGRPVAGPGGAYAMTGFSKNPANPFAAATGNESREGPYFEFKPSRLRLSPNTTNVGVLVYVDAIGGQANPYVYVTGYDGRGYQRADLYVGTGDDLGDVYRSGTGTTAVALKPKSFQIISPGADGLYGAGGYFDATATGHGITNAPDRDNISNFHGGLLKD